MEERQNSPFSESLRLRICRTQAEKLHPSGEAGVMTEQISLIPFSGQLIGQGYNSETGENVGTPLSVESVFEDASTDAQTAGTSFEMVTTQDALKESLGISASADGRVGMFSGGAKMSFSEENSVNTF